MSETEQIEKIAEAIRKHDIEWIKEFKELIRLVKSCTPEQIEACIGILKARG